MLGKVPESRERRFRAARGGLVTAAFLAPFSATHLIGSLTVGRAAAILFAVLLSVDVMRHRPRRFHFDLPAVLLVAGYVGLSAWILVNMAAIGCNCYGKAGGFLEFATIGVLSLVALSVEPRLRGPALGAVLAGTVLAAALALLGVGALNSGTVDLTRTGGRLSGTYGNANELGFATALALPIALCFLLGARDRAARSLLAAAAIVLAVALALTYSRGSIITAGAAVVAIGCWQARGSRRRLAIVAGATVLAVVLAGGLYSVFQRGREEASFEAVPVSLRGLSSRDLSGWDSRAMGPIPAGPSALANGSGGIFVRGDRPGEGVSIRWGEAMAGSDYTLRFRARSIGPGGRLRFALGDSVRVAGGARGEATVRARWRTFSLRWHPRLRAPHASAYLWGAGKLSAFELTDVRLLAREPGGRRRVLVIPTKLRGSIYGHLTSAAARAETRYLHSRLDASREALRAFRSAPVWGIGWQTFPSYADERLHYGPLAAHNQYLAIAAELGIIGLLLVAILFAAPVLGLRRNGSSEPDPAPIAVLAAALVGVVFVEALSVPQLSIPIAIAAAIVCRSSSGPRAARGSLGL